MFDRYLALVHEEAAIHIALFVLGEEVEVVLEYGLRVFRGLTYFDKSPLVD